MTLGLSEGVAVALIGAAASTVAAFLALLGVMLNVLRSNDRGHGEVADRLTKLERATASNASATVALVNEVSGVRTDLDTLIVSDSGRHEQNVMRLEHHDRVLTTIGAAVGVELPDPPKFPEPDGGS